MQKQYTIDLVETQATVNVKEVQLEEVTVNPKIPLGSVLLNFTQGKLFSFQVWANNQWLTTQPNDLDQLFINLIKPDVKIDKDQLFLVTFENDGLDEIEKLSKEPLLGVDAIKGA